MMASQNKDVPCGHSDVLPEGLDILKLMRSSRRLQLLVCGRTGVGKSSLINSLVGYEVCKVNDPGLATGSLKPGTTKVEKVSFKIENVAVDVFDSPGLQDGTENEKKYLEDMYRNCKDVDLFLYCVDMTIARFGNDEIETMRLITEKFGTEFWKRCLLVMTKANALYVPSDVRRKNGEQSYHKSTYATILHSFRTELRKQNVHRSFADVPGCAAGLCYKTQGEEEEEEGGAHDQRYIWYVSDKAKPSKKPLDFLTELWLMCLETMSAKSRSKFMKCTEKRMNPKGLSPDDQKLKEKYEQALRDRMEREKELEKRYQSQIREMELKHEAELSQLKEEMQKIPPPPPPDPETSAQYEFRPDGQQYERLADIERENQEMIEKMTMAGVVLGRLLGSYAAAYFGYEISSQTAGQIGGTAGNVLGNAFNYLRSWYRGE